MFISSPPEQSLYQQPLCLSVSRGRQRPADTAFATLASYGSKSARPSPTTLSERLTVLLGGYANSHLAMGGTRSCSSTTVVPVGSVRRYSLSAVCKIIFIPCPSVPAEL